MMRQSRIDELTRVMEKNEQINEELLSKCAYYPLFRFIDFIDKKTNERIVGQQLVCKKCSVSEPNKRCKRHAILLW
jgi:hypothetical protein